MRENNMKHVKLKEQPQNRIYVISDVHGHDELFKDTITDLQLTADDLLIILGDFVNKGPNSYKTFQYVKELSKRENTFVLKGNHEYAVETILNDPSKGDELLNILHKTEYETVIDSYLASINIELNQINTGIELLEVLSDFKSDYLNFITKLPVVLELPQILFVHGGYQTELDVNKNEYKLLKFDNYTSESVVNEKDVIVGHWPACNLRNDKYDNTPHFHHEKNIITIDGGLGIKTAGELNVLVIDHINGNLFYDFYQKNTFKEGIVVREQFFKKEEQYFVNYPHFEIDILEEGHELTKCRHIHSGKEISVINELVNKGEKNYVALTYINNFLNLKIGSKIEHVLDVGLFSFVKYKNEFGWVYRNQIRFES
jgi:Icc-related predicted phosphoesterase